MFLLTPRPTIEPTAIASTSAWETTISINQMDSSSSLFTPTAYFTFACCALSVAAASTVWRNKQVPVSNGTSKGAMRPPLKRPETHRRAVDSLYAQPGEPLYDALKARLSDLRPDSVAEVLAELLRLCAQVVDLLRSRHTSIQPTSLRLSLLNELNMLTTSLYQIQRALIAQPNSMEAESGRMTCFQMTSSFLKDGLALWESELERSSPDVSVLGDALQQLRDQRPSIQFLVDAVNVGLAPPTPPPEVASASQTLLKPSDAIGRSEHSSYEPPTGLTPAVDTRSWLEPPPEYSPPVDASFFGSSAEKVDSKSSPPDAQLEVERQPAGSEDLYNAVSDDDHDLIVELLRCDADPNKGVGDLGRTSLHQAAHLDHIRILSTLIRQGADMGVEDTKGDTALHLAAWSGHVESISVLLAHGAEVDWLSGRDGYTPLWCAISAYHVGAARLLLKHGAKVGLRSASGSGLLPLHQAAITGQSDMCELLLGRGAAVDVLDDDKNTPLHYAAVSGSASTVDMLLSHKATVRIRQAQGLTPAHWAAHKGHTDVLIALLEHGAAVDATATEGATPLHMAANRGHLAAVKTLLKHGADRDMKAASWDGVEGTALEMAMAKGQTAIVKLLAT